MQADRTMKSWLYCYIGNDVLDATMDLDRNTRQLYIAIKNLYTDNKELRAIFLSNQIHSFVQGNLTANYDETFNSVAKPATIHVVLSIAIFLSLSLYLSLLAHTSARRHAFLHGNLEEIVYCQQLTRFV